MLGERILSKLRRKTSHEVGLKDESVSALKDFWDRSAAVNAAAAVAFGVDDIWKSGENELKMLKPYLSDDANVLEVGCGIGRILYHVAPHCSELHGVDISAEMIRQARTHLRHLKNVHLDVGSGSDLPYPSDTFDLLYSCRVFQHIPKNIVLNYLKEAHRVLKPGKKFALQIPNILLDEHIQALNHFATPEYFKKPYPMYYYTPAEIERLGTYVGFRVEVVDDWLLAILTKP